MNSDIDSETHFMVDEDLIELESILKEMEYRAENPEIEKNKLILDTFVRGCIKAVKEPLPVYIPAPKVEKKAIVMPEEEKPTIIQEIENRIVGKEIYPVPSPGFNAIKEFKTIPKYKKEIKEIILLSSQILLIKDTVTNKPLAVADLGERYIIREPAINEKEIKILKEILEQKPETPEQSWDLLKQSAPDLSEDQLTNIKYYVINSLFALGRIEPLMHDPKVTTIICDGVGENIRVKRDNKLLKTNILFQDKEDLDGFLAKLAKKINKTLNESNPVIDTVHRNYRFSIILGLHGASSKFTIKKIE